MLNIDKTFEYELPYQGDNLSLIIEAEGGIDYDGTLVFSAFKIVEAVLIGKDYTRDKSRFVITSDGRNIIDVLGDGIVHALSHDQIIDISIAVDEVLENLDTSEFPANDNHDNFYNHMMEG